MRYFWLSFWFMVWHKALELKKFYFILLKHEQFVWFCGSHQSNNCSLGQPDKTLRVRMNVNLSVYFTCLFKNFMCLYQGNMPYVRSIPNSYMSHIKYWLYWLNYIKIIHFFFLPLLLFYHLTNSILDSWQFLFSVLLSSLRTNGLFFLWH